MIQIISWIGTSEQWQKTLIRNFFDIFNSILRNLKKKKIKAHYVQESSGVANWKFSRGKLQISQILMHNNVLM